MFQFQSSSQGGATPSPVEVQLVELDDEQLVIVTGGIIPVGGWASANMLAIPVGGWCGSRAGFARPCPAGAAADSTRRWKEAALGPGRSSTSWRYTRGPGLAGALLVGARGRLLARRRRSASPALGVHHLEGHLLSPFLSVGSAELPLRRARSSPAATRSCSHVDGRRAATALLGDDASTTLPARPSTSRPSCSASATPAGRRWPRLRRVRRPRRRTPCRGRCCSATRSTSPSPA